MQNMGGFHSISGPDFGFLPKIFTDKSLAPQCLDAYLLEDEHYAWDGPYNTKEMMIATRLGQSMGRLFVTNKRLIFWSDDLPRPHIGVFYSDIDGWKTTWMPLKSRGVYLVTGSRRYLFAANVTAVKTAEKFLQR
jgi:hypothetical protein